MSDLRRRSFGDVQEEGAFMRKGLVTGSGVIYSAGCMYVRPKRVVRVGLAVAHLAGGKLGG